MTTCVAVTRLVRRVVEVLNRVEVMSTEELDPVPVALAESDEDESVALADPEEPDDESVAVALPLAETSPATPVGDPVSLAEEAESEPEGYFVEV